MVSHLPRSVLISDVERVLPLVIRALEVTSAADTAAASKHAVSASRGNNGAQKGDSAVPQQPPAFAELRHAVASSALTSLRLLVTHAPAHVSIHVHTLVPVLLALARYAPGKAAKPTVRATAVDCLRGLISLPYHRLHPVRQQVVSGLIPVLDDPKRAVRRRAGACRNDWLTISTATVGGK